VECHNNQTSKSVFRLKAVQSANYDHVSILNTRHTSEQHTGNVHEVYIVCDHIFRTEIHVNDDSGIFENKVKSMEFYFL
jgi:hypothetical protein